MIKKSQLEEVGKVLKTHGIKGEVSCVFDDAICPEDMDFLIIEMEGIFVPFYINEIRIGNGQRVLIKIEGINDEREAAQMASKAIYMLKEDYQEIVDELKDPEKIYLEDLLGFTISDGEMPVGIIIGIDNRTENTLFIVETDNKKTIYIPAIEDFIGDVDFDHKKIVMNLPEGLTDL